jgi:hypothetical protein
MFFPDGLNEFYQFLGLGIQDNIYGSPRFMTAQSIAHNANIPPIYITEPS